MLNAATVITDAEAAVTDCQNPGFACGQEIGDIIKIIAGLGARVQRDRALMVIAAREELRAKHQLKMKMIQK